MKKKFIIIFSIILITLLVVLVVLGGGENVPVSSPSTQTISSVTVDIDGEKINYGIEILTNNIQFDSEIQSHEYSEIIINQTQDYVSKGFAFIVKPYEETTMKFLLKVNNEVVKNFTILTKAFKNENVNLMIENSIKIKKEDEVKIEIISSTETRFLFDSLLCFVGE